MLPIIDDPGLPAPVRGLLNTVIFLLSLVILERSADSFVDSTAVVARRLRISAVLVGLLTAGAEWEEVRRANRLS
jgi:Ca2+/Na+ antiporter